MLQANALHLIGHKLSGPPDVVFMIGEGTYTRDPQQVLEFAQKSLLVLTRVINCRTRHGPLFLVLLTSLKRFKSPTECVSIPETDAKAGLVAAHSGLTKAEPRRREGSNVKFRLLSS